MARTLAALIAAVLLAAPGGKAPTAIATYQRGSEKVFLTSDGRVWRNVTPHALGRNVDDAIFADAEHGWIVTSDCAAGKGTLLRTSDGGRTWSRRPFPAPSCNAGAGTTLRFLDQRHGWAIHAEPTAPFEALSVTADGGRSWRFVSHGLPVVGPVLFRTRRDGWLGGLRLFRTGDGGRYWRRIRLPVPRGNGNPERANDSFTPPVFHGQHALLAASFLRGKRLLVWIYSTPDAGRRWIVQARFHAKTHADSWVGTLASVPAPRSEWVIAGGLLYLTADDGAHWSRRPLPFHVVERLVALDARSAVVETEAGGAFVTHDGGATWVRTSFTSGELYRRANSFGMMR